MGVLREKYEEMKKKKILEMERKKARALGRKSSAFVKGVRETKEDIEFIGKDLRIPQKIKKARTFLDKLSDFSSKYVGDTYDVGNVYGSPVPRKRKKTKRRRIRKQRQSVSIWDL